MTTLLAALFDTLESQSIPIPAATHVEYVDENDPEKGVQFVNKAGYPVMWMPTEDYLKLRKSSQ